MGAGCGSCRKVLGEAVHEHFKGLDRLVSDMRQWMTFGMGRLVANWKQKSGRLWGLRALLLLAILGLPGATVIQVSLDQMIAEAEFVFEGRVVGMEARENVKTKAINTYVTFEILDVIKGPAREGEIELSFFGGTVGGRSLSVSGLHLPSLGEHGIYFVESLSSQMVSAFYGWDQGHLLVIPDEDGNERVFTFERKPITEVNSDTDPSTRKPFSDGVARGLVEGNKDDPDSALDLGRFKSGLRELQGKKAQ